MKSFKQYVSESKPLPDGWVFARDIFSKAQKKSLSKIDHYDIFIDPRSAEPIVKKEKSDYSIKDYQIKNPKNNKYEMKVTMTNRGKVYAWTSYKRDGNSFNIIKHWNIDNV
jgi:hypothetical protein